MNNILTFNLNNFLKFKNFAFFKQFRFYGVFVIGLFFFFGLNIFLYIENDTVNLKTIFYIKVLISSIIFSAHFSVIFHIFKNKYKSLEAFIFSIFFISIISLIFLLLFYLNNSLGLFVAVLSKLLLLALFSFFFIKSTKDTQLSTLKISAILVLLPFFIIMVGTVKNNFLAFSDIQYITSHIYGLALPIDNWLPKVLYNQINSSSIETPMLGDWLSSDRPPLQTALLFFFKTNGLSDVSYLVYSVSLQLLVIIFSIYLFDRVFSSKLLKYILFCLIFFNGMVFVNTIFVWPKMLSALYQAMALYYVYVIIIEQSKKKLYYVLFGLSFILAFLSHGGGIFYLIGLGLILAVYSYNTKQFLNLQYTFLTISILYLPWMIYQKFIDPPGDRLLKWHLADQIEITDKSFLDIIIQKYTSFDIYSYIDYKISQIKTVFGEIFSKYIEFFNSIDNTTLVTKSFFDQEYSYLFFSSFFLILAFFIKIRDDNEKYFFNLLLVSYLLYLFFWIFLLLSSPVLHHGSSFGWIVGILVIFLATYYFNKYLAISILLCNLTFFCVGYIYPQFELFSEINTTNKFVKENSLLTTTFISNSICDYKKLDGFLVYGSCINGDQDVVTIKFMFNLDNSFIYKTGPKSKKQIIDILDLTGSKLLSRNLPKSEVWSIYKFDEKDLPQTFIVKLVDNGTGWGEWSAVAFKKEDDERK